MNIDHTKLDDTSIPGQHTWKYINENFLHLCNNKSVVEIGPYDGWISEYIVTQTPTSLTLLEANTQAIDNLRSNAALATCKILLGDMHCDLDQVGPVDVAVVLGVIYHSHAPLLFLEELVNQCNPQTILLDNPGQMFNWSEENINAPGMRHVVDNKKTCGIVITIDEAIILAAMKNLGYTLHLKQTLPQTLNFKAKSVPIYQFERLNG